MKKIEFPIVKSFRWSSQHSNESQIPQHNEKLSKSHRHMKSWEYFFKKGQENKKDGSSKKN